MILIFSEKNKMFLMASEKKVIHFGPYLSVQNMKKNQMIEQNVNKIIRFVAKPKNIFWFVAKQKKINNSDIKAKPSPWIFKMVDP